MTEREQTFDLDTTRLLRARRSADGVVAQYIRELADRRDECRAPAEAGGGSGAGGRCDRVVREPLGAIATV